MLCHIEVQNTPCTDFHDQEHIHHSECRCHDDAKIGCNDGVGVIMNESHPSLRRGFLSFGWAAAYNDGPYAAKSESQVSIEAHRRSVPRPKSDCSLPYRQSIFEGPWGCWADLLAISISKTAEILSDANG